MPTSLSWNQVVSWRLARHHLDRPAGERSAVRVVGDLCGAQAQLMTAAAWATRADMAT